MKKSTTAPATMALFLILAACGEPDPVDLVATTPEEGATDVAVDTAIVLEFSRPLNSVSAQLSPEAPMTRIEAGSNDDGHWVVEYEPDQPLQGATDYELSIGVIDTTQRFLVNFRTEGED
jgi:hypothetical protein